MQAQTRSETYPLFSGPLATLLSEHWQQAGGAPCSFEASEEASGHPEALAGPDQALSLLRFEGALVGVCVISCNRADLSRLAGASEPEEQRTGQQAAGELLVRVVALLAETFASSLSMQYGSVRIQVLESTEPAPSDGEVIARWMAHPADALNEAGVFLTLLADGDLHRSLARLARVAAAAEASGITSGNLGLVMDVELEVTLRFGQRQLSLREVMDLASGSVVELDREVDEPVELILDGRVIARGEAVIVDGNYGVRVTEILQQILP